MAPPPPRELFKAIKEGLTVGLIEGLGKEKAQIEPVEELEWRPPLLVNSSKRSKKG